MRKLRKVFASDAFSEGNGGLGRGNREPKRPLAQQDECRCPILPSERCRHVREPGTRPRSRSDRKHVPHRVKASPVTKQRNLAIGRGLVDYHQKSRSQLINEHASVREVSVGYMLDDGRPPQESQDLLATRQ